MMKILLSGSAGSFSLFTQSAVVLMEEEGLQEIKTAKMKISVVPDSFVVLIFRLLIWRMLIQMQSKEYCVFGHRR